MNQKVLKYFNNYYGSNPESRFSLEEEQSFIIKCITPSKRENSVTVKVKIHSCDGVLDSISIKSSGPPFLVAICSFICKECLGSSLEKVLNLSAGYVVGELDLNKYGESSTGAPQVLKILKRLVGKL